MFLLLARAGLAQPASTSQPTAAQLQSLSGEYIDPVDSDTPLSVYPQDGKLFRESERSVPAELTPVSASEFLRSGPGPKVHYTFSLDPSGHASSLTITYQDSAEKTVLRRTGDPVHHVFPPYDRQEVMIPMRDGVKLHAIILKPANLPGLRSIRR